MTREGDVYRYFPRREARSFFYFGHSALKRDSEEWEKQILYIYIVRGSGIFSRNTTSFCIYDLVSYSIKNDIKEILPPVYLPFEFCSDF